jgi:mono/diheme cytochrome c family protein
MQLFFKLAPAALLVFVATGCMEQYDPTRYKAQEERERVEGDKPTVKLTDTGEIPASGPAGPRPAEECFQSFCSGCHGAGGGGDGPAGQALTPHPRNFTDVTWQSKVDDEHIYNVISKGGAANGLSPMMAPWGAVLSDQEIKGLVAKIRTLKKG